MSSVLLMTASSITGIGLGIGCISPPLVRITGPSSIALDVQNGNMYWIDYDRARIRCAGLDGSKPRTLVREGRLYDLSIDSERGKIYWLGRYFYSTKIRRANLDGTGVEDVIGTGIWLSEGITLDSENQKLYWAECGPERIRRANLDGSGVEDVLTNENLNPELQMVCPSQIAVDPTAGKIYWTDSKNRIQRCNLDGICVENLITHVAYTGGMVLDKTAGKVYWADHGSLRRANLDGTAPEDVVLDATGGQESDVAVDGEARKIYWTDRAKWKIRRANLDGSGIEDVYSSPFHRLFAFKRFAREAR